MREISEKEYQSLHGQVSIKSIYEKKKGKEVSLDHFLFTCYDTTRQLSEIDHRKQNNFTWPGFEEDLSEISLEDGIQEMIVWYKKKYPTLSFKGTMDISKMVNVAKSLAYFERDFKNFVKVKTGEYLEDHLLDQHDLAPPWTYLKQHLNDLFRGVGDKIWTYFTWAYGISPPSEMVNLSDIPPVSRFRYQEAHNPQTGSSYSSHNRHPQRPQSQRNRKAHSPQESRHSAKPQKKTPSS